MLEVAINLYELTNANYTPINVQLYISRTQCKWGCVSFKLEQQFASILVDAKFDASTEPENSGYSPWGYTTSLGDCRSKKQRCLYHNMIILPKTCL